MVLSQVIFRTRLSLPSVQPFLLIAVGLWSYRFGIIGCGSILDMLFTHGLCQRIHLHGLKLFEHGCSPS